MSYGSLLFDLAEYRRRPAAQLDVPIRARHAHPAWKRPSGVQPSRRAVATFRVNSALATNDVRHDEFAETDISRVAR